jgi:hypothetical protein
MYSIQYNSSRPDHWQNGLMVLPPGFLRIFSEITYIRAVGNYTFLKPKPYHYHSMNIAETQLSSLLNRKKEPWPWMSAVIYSRVSSLYNTCDLYEYTKGNILNFDAKISAGFHLVNCLLFLLNLKKRLRESC